MDNYDRNLFMAAVAAFILFVMFIMVNNGQAETYYAFCLPDSYVNARELPDSRANVAGYLYCGDAYEVGGVKKDKRGRTWLESDKPIWEVEHAYVCSMYMSDTPVIVEFCRVRVDGPGRVAIRKPPDGERSAWAHEGDILQGLAYNDYWALTDKGYIKMNCITWLEGEL